MINTSNEWKVAVANGTRFKNKLHFDWPIGSMNRVKIIQHIPLNRMFETYFQYVSIQRPDSTWEGRAYITKNKEHEFLEGHKLFFSFQAYQESGATSIEIYVGGRLHTSINGYEAHDQIITLQWSGKVSVEVVCYPYRYVPPEEAVPHVYLGNLIDLSDTFSTVPTVAQFRAESGTLSDSAIHNGTEWDSAFFSTITDITDEYIFSLTFSDSIEDGGIPLGTAVMNEVNATLQNFTKWFTVNNLKGKTFTLYFGLDINGTTEWIQRGIYTVQSAKLHNNLLSIVAYDNFYKAECTKTITSASNKRPADLFSSIATLVGASASGLPYTDKNDLMISGFPLSSDEYSMRQVLAWLAMMCGGYAYVKPDGSYSINRLYDLSLGAYTTLVNVSSFEIDEETTLTGLEFAFPQNADGSNAGQKALHGTDGCVVSVSDCPMFDGDYSSIVVANKSASVVAGLLWNRLCDYETLPFVFTPFTVTAQADPSIQCGDTVRFSDALGNDYSAIVTNLEYTADGRETYSCGIEIPKEQNFTVNDTAQLTGYSVSSAIQAIKDDNLECIGVKNYVVAEGTETVGSFTWRYRKWSNGQAEIWGAYGVSGLALTYQSGSLYYNAKVVPTRPSWFSLANAQVTINSPNGLVFAKYASATNIQIVSATSQSSWSGTLWIQERGTWS